jgi:benzoyl-CoA reductase/2-hydroxyglutaryl-CoA dehydratase subunit BcrC/BadD/HgdB
LENRNVDTIRKKICRNFDFVEVKKYFRGNATKELMKYPSRGTFTMLVSATFICGVLSGNGGGQSGGHRSAREQNSAAGRAIIRIQEILSVKRCIYVYTNVKCRLDGCKLI